MRPLLLGAATDQRRKSSTVTSWANVSFSGEVMGSASMSLSLGMAASEPSGTILDAGGIEELADTARLSERLLLRLSLKVREDMEGAYMRLYQLAFSTSARERTTKSPSIDFAITG